MNDEGILSVGEAIDAIRNRKNSLSAKLAGEIKADDIARLRDAIRAGGEDCLVSLDLSKTAGLKDLKDEAFLECAALKSVILPDSVESIGKKAFSKCTALTSFVVPVKVSRIRKKTFCKCRSLKSVVLPQMLTEIGKKAFKKCSSLSSIELPPKLSSIGKSAFYGCSSLESINIPDMCIFIGDQAFGRCAKLTHFSIGTSYAYSSEGGVLYNKDKTRLLAYPTATGEIHLASGLKEIEAYALAETAVTAVSIPEGVASINANAFENCVELKSVSIPSTVTSIGAWAFAGCKSLGNVSLPAGLSQLGASSFRSCAIKSIVLPEGLKTIDSGAFSYCACLGSLDIPPSVFEIGASVVYMCNALTHFAIADTDGWYMTDDEFNWRAKNRGTEIDVASIAVADFAAIDGRFIKAYLYKK